MQETAKAKTNHELRLYNSLGRRIAGFTPAAEVAGMYTCGPTVYAYPHLGNMRAYVFADTVRRQVLSLDRNQPVSDVKTLSAVIDDSEDQRRLMFALLGAFSVAATLLAVVEARQQEVAFQLLVGHPAEQIVRYAEQQHVDLLVTGHRGRTLFQRFRLGSVSRQALHYAHCAVLVVR